MQAFRKITCLAFILLWGIGCTHTHILAPEEPGSYASLNERAAQQGTHVMLADGQRFSAAALQMTPDWTSWIDPASGSVMNVATSEVAAVQFNRHGRGAWEGLGLGLLSGAVTGAAIGFADGDDESGFLTSTAEEKALGGGILLGGAGGLLGLLVGAAVGSKDVYLPEPPYPASTQ